MAEDYVRGDYKPLECQACGARETLPGSDYCARCPCEAAQCGNGPRIPGSKYCRDHGCLACGRITHTDEQYCIMCVCQQCHTKPKYTGFFCEDCFSTITYENNFENQRGHGDEDGDKKAEGNDASGGTGQTA